MNDRGDVPQPAIEADQDHLPSALTFFLTRGQRRAIVRALRALDHDRNRALIRAASIIGAPPESQHGSDQQES